jgi:type II secretory pathway pseudopilin PulG
MIKKIHFFNMIEVLLALTVIAIGMTSVLGLFPVGLNASRNAVAQNMSADVADQMVTYMRVMGESSDAAYNSTFDYNDSVTTDLPDYTGLDIQEVGDTITIDLNGYVDFTDTTDLDVQALGDAFLAEYKAGTFTNYPRVANKWAIFAPKLKTISPAPNTRRRIYFIVQGPNSTEDGGNRNIDYSAMVLVWKSPVQINRYDGSGWTMWPADTDIYSNSPTNTIIKPDTAYDYSAKVNVELSWPLELPYAERKKRYYQVVITKPN